ncbi:MAG: flagellar FlbD family protein [Peptostreptococcaceae bacterium]|nr:flagellar FlbD family protein [Peptostreptococcaceae bacterium]
MIKLTKLNGEPFALNSDHIVAIDIIPDSKITLTNKEFYIVRESLDEIIQLIIGYNQQINGKQ